MAVVATRLPFVSQLSGFEFNSPVRGGVAVTASDTDDLVSECRYLLVGVAGNVKVTTSDGDVLILPLVAGWNPVMCTRVWSTSTTATSIFALR